MIGSSGNSKPVYLDTHKYPLDPGDGVSASVTYQNNGKYQLKLWNYTKGWTFSTTAKAKGSETLAARSSAECITEDPTNGNSVDHPLANFGTVTFDGCSSSGNDIGSVGPLTVTFVMTDNGQPDGTVMARPGNIQHGDQFDVVWYSGGH
jgi:hypothetical protein